MEQLSESTGEESLILTASIADGSFSHLGSERGKIFLQNHDNIKSQFLGFCLTGMYNVTCLSLFYIHVRSFFYKKKY